MANIKFSIRDEEMTTTGTIVDGTIIVSIGIDRRISYVKNKGSKDAGIVKYYDLNGNVFGIYPAVKLSLDSFIEYCRDTYKENLRT